MIGIKYKVIVVLVFLTISFFYMKTFFVKKEIALVFDFWKGCSTNLSRSVVAIDKLYDKAFIAENQKTFFKEKLKILESEINEEIVNLQLLLQETMYSLNECLIYKKKHQNNLHYLRFRLKQIQIDISKTVDLLYAFKHDFIYCKANYEQLQAFPIFSKQFNFRSDDLDILKRSNNLSKVCNLLYSRNEGLDAKGGSKLD